ncbi:class I SAM-dependent methyltransferase [Microlunatus parietis]|uniref:Methyltransferase domain-containing protein n=1 Tax=Microlunatus parietis TaxID=682979 RepID=A0A7Y9IF25_9ACTN|nr:class I SAM-dependent methyltransferase [Microlunatus parietis]NYE75595.1 hypothetical protein [Microlunatus parietis]
MKSLEVLAEIHRRLQPERYLEIGVRQGHSLALARCQAIGIDPQYAIEAELRCDVALFRTTSDDYFNRPDPLEPTGGRPFDLAYVDGLHLFEFVLRDVINVERCSSPRGVILLDGVLPRNVDEAARVRHTGVWTGDAYQLIGVLRTYRPDLAVVPLATEPTGMLLLAGLDPTNTVLAARYDQIVSEFRATDPQQVPADLLDRLDAQPAARVLESDLWSVLREASPTDGPVMVQQQVAGCLSTHLGPAFAR